MSVDFARKIMGTLQLDRVSQFRIGKLAGFEGRNPQDIDVALRGHLRVQNRLIRYEWFLIIDTPTFDIVVGRKWFADHDVLVDCRRRRLLFPPDWEPDYYDTDICMDEHGELLKDPAYQQDVIRRERLMERDDRRKRDGYSDKTKAPRYLQEVQDRIKELERKKEEDKSPEPGKVPPATVKKQVRFELPVSILRPTPRSLLGDDVGQAKMQRALDGVRPPTPAQPLGKVEETRAPKKPPSRDQWGEYHLRRDSVGWYKDYVMDFAVIGAAPLMAIAGRKESYLGVTSLYEMDRFIEEKKRAAAPDEPELRNKIETTVPQSYHKWLDVFSKNESDLLPERRPGVDHKIELDTGHTADELHYSPLYKMSLDEAEACRKYIVENLAKGFIESSHAPWAAPVLFAPKPGGRGLRFCVDYRRLNAITRKDRYPLPLIDETMARIGQAKIFTKIDIRQAFHRIRMDPDAEELTTFRTRYGAYKYKVLPFGLTNGPSTFQRYINETLMGYLDDFCSAYIDDILIYSSNELEHQEHVAKVLTRLREAGLQADIEKCEFHVKETKFLGFIVGTEGIAVDPDKVVAVRDWKEPTTVKGVQSFLGFCNFYRRFVKEYSRIAKPLNNLTCKETPFRWTDECQLAFDTLKTRLLEAPVLTHFKHGKPTKLETDASDGVIAGVLTQLQDDGEWHPVGYFSEAMHGAEYNYPIHDKELLAVVRALRFWRSELIGLQDPFTIITDHEALVYFGTKRLLNLRQAGWAEQLAQFHFQITYRPGTQNGGADALSRKAEDLVTQKAKKEAMRMIRIFQQGDGTNYTVDADGSAPEYEATMCTMVIGDKTVPILTLDGEDCLPDISGYRLMEELIRANKEDPELEVYREKARQGHTDLTLTAGHLLLYQGRLVVSGEDTLRTQVLEEVHARLVGGHPGRHKTKKLLQARYWWPGLPADADRYVANCACQAAKPPRGKTPGLLRPLPIPQRPWRHLVMDFKQMPKDKKGYDNALIIIDRLSKFVQTIPCYTTVTARDTACLYYERVFSIFGCPESVVSDRGPQFVADFTDELSRIMGTKWKLSAPGHSQTAGQAEIMIQYLEQRLRPFVNHYQDNWVAAVPAMDYVHNGTPHESIGMEPHEALMGYPMPKLYDWEPVARSLEDSGVAERRNRQEARDVATTIHTYVEYARKMMGHAQSRMIEQANRHRKEPDFDVGDHVRVIRKTWSSPTDRVSDKLDFPLTRGHYMIREKVGHAYLLELPDSWQGPTLFSADRLVYHANNPMPGQAAENPEAEAVDGEEEWEVQQVTASRLFRGRLKYQVQWKSWDPDPKWYSAELLRNSPLKLQQYHEANPDKAGPPIRLPEWLKAAKEDRFCEPHEDDNKPVPDGGTTRIRRNRVRK